MESGSTPRVRGFSYLFVLIAVAVLGSAAAFTLSAGSTMARRDSEHHMRLAGQSIAQALESYAKATPLGQPLAPRSLEMLLRDDRYPTLVRHLRRVPIDPLTGRDQWGIVLDPQGLIAGVHSLAEGAPIQESDRQKMGAAVAGEMKSYRDLVFMPTKGGHAQVVPLNRPGERGVSADRKLSPL